MLERPLEMDHWQQDQLVLGIDEAGRGPIAGPLVVAGVCFDKGFSNKLIDDSKKLSEKKRESLFSIITSEALWYQILIIEESIIDKKNIYRACQDATYEIAKHSLVDFVYTDAMPLPGFDRPYEAVVKADQKSISVAAASILAKVTRDRYMKKLDVLYPEYGFAKHKGYPTKAHIEALDKYGVLEYHRKSYGPVQKKLEIRLF